MNNKKEWFGEWFDSPFYHILYKDRDNKEAHDFMDKLSLYFNFSENQRILDLACGKGRHAIYLNKKGFQVTGVDLAESNIEYASQYANDKLDFYIHDMREVFAYNQFDYILNLFTSFGYFDNVDEHFQVVSGASKALKKGGKLIIDFLNPYKVINRMVPEEIKTIDGITFHITKELSKDKHILKHIKFFSGGKHYAYQEKVKAIRRVEFLNFFEKAGLKCDLIWGDYNLAPYNKESADRMIFLAEKFKG